MFIHRISLIYLVSLIPLAQTISGDRDAKPMALTNSPTAGQPAPQKGGGESVAS